MIPQQLEFVHISLFTIILNRSFRKNCEVLLSGLQNSTSTCRHQFSQAVTLFIDRDRVPQQKVTEQIYNFSRGKSHLFQLYMIAF